MQPFRPKNPSWPKTKYQKWSFFQQSIQSKTSDNAGFLRSVHIENNPPQPKKASGLQPTERLQQVYPAFDSLRPQQIFDFLGSFGTKVEPGAPLQQPSSSSPVIVNPAAKTKSVFSRKKSKNNATHSPSSQQLALTQGPEKPSAGFETRLPALAISERNLKRPAGDFEQTGLSKDKPTKQAHKSPKELIVSTRDTPEQFCRDNSAVLPEIESPELESPEMGSPPLSGANTIPVANNPSSSVLKHVEQHEKQRQVEQEQHRQWLIQEKQRKAEQEKQRQIKQKKRRRIQQENQKLLEQENQRQVEQEKQKQIEQEKQRQVEQEEQRRIEREKQKQDAKEKQRQIEQEKQKLLQQRFQQQLDMLASRKTPVTIMPETVKPVDRALVGSPVSGAVSDRTSLVASILASVSASASISASSSPSNIDPSPISVAQSICSKEPIPQKLLSKISDPKLPSASLNMLTDNTEEPATTDNTDSQQQRVRQGQLVDEPSVLPSPPPQQQQQQQSPEIALSNSSVEKDTPPLSESADALLSAISAAFEATEAAETEAKTNPCLRSPPSTDIVVQEAPEIGEAIEFTGCIATLLLVQELALSQKDGALDRLTSVTGTSLDKAIELARHIIDDSVAQEQ